MKINLFCIGKTDDREIKSLTQYYHKRLPAHWNYAVTEIPDVKNTKNMTPAQVMAEESKLILQQIEASDLVILLDENGRHYTSREFSDRITSWMNSSVKRICFFIGGAYGFAPAVHARANEKISLSKMTFTHQMVRLFFTEQLYRADQILQGKPYHND